MERPDLSRDHVAGALRLLGYTVQDLPTSCKPTCDLRAKLEGEELWVEVKDSHPPDGTHARIAAGEAVPLVTPLARDAKLRDDFRHAANQLESSAADIGGLHLVWFRVHSPGDIQRAQALYCTLYGIRWMHITAGPLRAPPCNLVPCFRAGRSLFASYPRICGVAIDTPGGIGLRVNPHSPDRSRLIESRLYREIDSMGGVFDLDIFGEFFKVYDAAACVEPLEADVIQALRQRYGVTAKAVKPKRNMGCSVATQGNEQGGCSNIPGDRQFVSYFTLLKRRESFGAEN